MSIQIVINDDVTGLLASKCIGADDVKTAVTNAECDKLYFEGADGERLCALKMENLTYWVSYAPCGAALEVRNAYFHRMRFDELSEG